MANAIDVATRFHIGLYVSDLARSTQFYRILLGRSPIKQFSEYSRFECEDPGLVLTLKPHQTTGGGILNHVGIRVTNAQALVEIQRRLEEHGIATQRQEGVECCYAKQTKFWVTDPDRVLWELYILEEDIDHSGFDDPSLPHVTEESKEPRAVWEHRLSDPFPQRLPYDDGTLDEVQLLGTLNAMVEPGESLRRLGEVARVLKAGGRVLALGLIGDKPYHQRLDLPGQASKCEYLPRETEPLELLSQAGFQNVFYEKLHDVNCISVLGIDLRSFRLTGMRLADNEQPRRQLVMYRGPFASIVDDEGEVFHRGERTYVTAAKFNCLSTGPAAGQFVFFSLPRSLPLTTISLSNDCCG